MNFLVHITFVSLLYQIFSRASAETLNGQFAASHAWLNRLDGEKLGQRNLSYADNRQRQKQGGVKGQNTHTQMTQRNKDGETERE